MQHLRDVTGKATRLLARAGAAVWLTLTVAAAAMGLDAARLDLTPSQSSVRRTVPQLHHLTPASRVPQLHVPADAIVDPLAERWQLDVTPAAAPECADLTRCLLRLAAAHGPPACAPFLVRSFARPPPARL